MKAWLAGWVARHVITTGPSEYSRLDLLDLPADLQAIADRTEYDRHHIQNHTGWVRVGMQNVTDRETLLQLVKDAK